MDTTSNVGAVWAAAPDRMTSPTSAIRTDDRTYFIDAGSCFHPHPLSRVQCRRVTMRTKPPIGGIDNHYGAYRE